MAQLFYWLFLAILIAGTIGLLFEFAKQKRITRTYLFQMMISIGMAGQFVLRDPPSGIDAWMQLMLMFGAGMFAGAYVVAKKRTDPTP